jgi:hypothetical protein
LQQAARLSSGKNWTFAMKLKIITADAEGAGKAARDAAQKLEIPNAGCERSADERPNSDPAATLAIVRQSESRSLTEIERCVLHSDATLALTCGEAADRLAAVRDLTRRNHRPWLHIDLDVVPAFKAATQIVDWLTHNKVAILNVTGAPNGVAPKIYEKTYHILTSVFWLLESRLPLSGTDSRGLTAETAPGADRRQPKTVEAALALLTSRMTLKDCTTLANLTEQELASLNYTLGSYIRNKFGLWSGNQALLQSCREASGEGNLHEKDAADVIIKALWQVLRKTHKLRVVK